MTALLLAFTLASHNPYHWTMTCKRFHEASREVMMDKNLDYRAKQQILRLFRSKVEERCDDVFI
jgi:hypothetical protein